MTTVRWNLDEMSRALVRLDTERRNLETQRNQMQAQQSRVDVNWRSPAGQQYQNRLQEDMGAIDGIVRFLERHGAALRRVHGHYSSAEQRIRSALSTLPR